MKSDLLILTPLITLAG